MDHKMKRCALGPSIVSGAVALCIFSAAAASAADQRAVHPAPQAGTTGQKPGEAPAERAQAAGKTVGEAVVATGERIAEASKAAEPHARSAWKNLGKGVVDLGASLEQFFRRLFR